MRKVFHHDFVVTCSPDEAFDFLSDLRNELEWNPDMCQSVEMLTDGPVGKGTRYLAKWKGGPASEVEYTYYERPNCWRAHTAGSLECNFEGKVEPHPDGARVLTELELIPHGFFKLFFPIMKIMFNKEAVDATERMKKALNARFGDSAKAAA